MANNMYRVGDCVYFETSSAAPYQIRRIEELCKTPTGNVEAKVMSFYRRRDLSQNLISLADKHQCGSDDENGGSSVTSKEDLTERQRHQLKHRELFLSRQIESLPATHIRGKCNITLLNETEQFANYLVQDDSFFYSLVYDPQQKTLLADKGEIRVGPRFQAETPKLLEKGESDGRDLRELEDLVWTCENSLIDKQIDNFLMLASSPTQHLTPWFTFSPINQPTQHPLLIFTLFHPPTQHSQFHAMHLLHKNNYRETDAMNQLVPPTGPVLCRDELEEWSSAEASIFEEALDKNGKDFFEIRNEALPWKTHKALVEYYYMWKTTDRYVQQKRVKAAEAESKLKQVYIPSYNKPNPAQLVDKVDGRSCESCHTASSGQWFSWGPSVIQGRVCSLCWVYWKKYGGLKMASRLDNNSVSGSNGHHNNNNNNNNNVASIINEKSPVAPTKVFKCSAPGCGKTDFRSKSQLLQHLSNSHGMTSTQSTAPTGSNSPCPVMKTRAAFCLVTTPLTRMSRQICRGILDIRKACRHPFLAINIASVKLECQQRFSEMSQALKALKPRQRLTMLTVSSRLGIDANTAKPPILARTSDSQKENPNPRKRPLENSEQKIELPPKIPASVPPPSKGEDTKKNKTPQATPARSYQVKRCRPKTRGVRKSEVTPKTPPQISESFEDACFVVSEIVRQLRKKFSTGELKKVGRKPWKGLSGKEGGVGGGREGVVVLD